MGTNVGDFLKEAHRILRPGGVVKIAEVRSRFEGASNKDGMKKFFRILKRAGFVIGQKDFDNKMFFLVECTKSVDEAKKVEFDENYSIQACLYKKR